MANVLAFYNWCQANLPEILSFVAGLLINLKSIFPSLAESGAIKALNSAVEFLTSIFKKKPAAPSA